MRFVTEVLRRYGEDQGAVLAGYIAYAAMLSAFPFMIFATALAGMLIGTEHSGEAVGLLFEVAPDHVARTLQPVLEEVIGKNRGGILTLSALGAIYGASNGVEAIRIGLDRAYDVERPRNFVMNRVWSICFVFIGFSVFGVLAVLIIFAPLVFTLIEAWTTFDIPVAADLARYIVGAALLYGYFWLMHLTLPARAMRGMRLFPGIIVSMVMWVLLASAMSIYLAFAPSYAVTYGTLAGVVVTLLFFYMSGVTIIIGAEVNAVINFGLPPDEPELPLEEGDGQDG